MLSWMMRGTALALTAATCVVADAAELRVISTPAMKPVMDQLAPLFRAVSGHALETLYTPEETLLRRVREGEPLDVVIAPMGSIDALVRDHRVDGRTVTFVARSALGLAVRAGASHPDISTYAGLKGALLGARSVAYSDPIADPSGKQVARVLEQLRISNQMRSKALFPPPQERVGNLVASGAAQMGIDQFLNLAQVDGIDIVGALPSEVQDTLVISAGAITGARNLALTRPFLDFVRSAEAASAIRSKGLQPAHFSRSDRGRLAHQRPRGDGAPQAGSTQELM